MAVEELRGEPMMAHLLDSLAAGEDIGHYGRLVFAMIARHFLDEQDTIDYLTKNPEFSEDQARALVNQVTARGYNPPKRERILEWMRQQEFPSCPEPDNAGQCTVYRNLQFPPEVYERIAHFYEQGERNN